MKPLQDITVLELSTMVTASLCSMMLAEQGARVIKIEPLELGDPLRYIGTAKGGISGLFANCNRGKESVRIDLKSPRGQALVQKMSEQADILVHNFRPGVMDRLDLGSEALRDRNPRLIYMAISGFGSNGPLRDVPAYDPVIQASSGMTASQGMGSHAFIRNLMCDKLTAYTACQALSTALYHRERSGSGQHIDLSMLDASMAFMFPDAYQNHTLLDDDVELKPLLTEALHELSLTKDGAVTISAGNAEQRAGALTALGKAHLISDPRFSSMEALLANIDDFRTELAEGFASMTTDEVIEKFQQHDVPCARCFSIDELLEHPQVQANQALGEQQHPVMGRLRTMAVAARFGGERCETGAPCPEHGEHTQSTLRSFDYDDDSIDALIKDAVIA